MEADPTHTYDVAGTYAVTLAVTDTKGGTDTETIHVAVAPPPGQEAGLLLVGLLAAAVAAILLVAVLLLRRRRGFREVGKPEGEKPPPPA